MKLCLLAICLLVIIATVYADRGGGGKGKGGKGGMMKHMKKWKWCGEKEATYDDLVKKWEECKVENPKPEESEGADGDSGEESGGKPKKHEHWKKMHDCMTKKLDIVNEDGSVDGEKVKQELIKAFGQEVGAKLGDKIITDCGEKMAAAKEGEGMKKVMKCAGEVHKDVCGKKE